VQTDTFITEIRNSLKQYDTAGLIDEYSIIDWIYSGLRQFGNLITTKTEAVVDIVDGKGQLPQNFESLDYAILCEPSCVESEYGRDYLQQAYFWKERVEKSDAWNKCGDCEKNYSEKTIVEKHYYHEKPVKMHYKNPQPLKLSRFTKKDYYARGCRNLKQDCKNEITLNNKIIYTNFSEGSVYMIYYGFETDEDKPIIPDTPQGKLQVYLKYYVQRNLFETIWLNSDDANLENKIQYLVAQERQEFARAMADARNATLTIGGFYNIERQARKNRAIFEAPFLR